VSDTPFSDSTAHNVAELGMLCRRLERELNESNQIIRQQQLLDEENLRLQQRIQRLEELGNELRECANQIEYTSSHEIKWLKRAGLAVKAWDKEAKL
jgi:hypothetical protein